jgi:hypothetical protein
MTLILSGTDGLSDVDGTAATPALRGSDANTGIFFPAADTIAFAEGGAEVARFDSAGNLGIGTTTPDDITTNYTTVDVRGSVGGGLRLGVAAGNNMALYASATTSVIEAAGSAPLQFVVNASERARLNSTGAFVLAGGTTTADGIGITFPATQSASTNANTLDDYEEGAWTPVFQNAGTGTYSAQTGRYIKIGSQVFAYFHLSLGTLGTASGALKIIGLPFTSANISANYGTASSIHANSFVTARTGELNSLIVPNTATTTEFFYGMASTTSLTLSHADMGATGNLLGCLIYQAA